MAKLRIVFMGTPAFAVPCLDMLIREGREVLAVVTQPDRPKGRGRRLAAPPVKECAQAHGLPVWQPEKVKAPAVTERLAALAPDVIVVVAFGQLLPPEILAVPRWGCVNVHASLLPRYRGAAPIHWAVMRGETATGVTTMRMDAGLDTGDMLLSRRIDIGPDATTGEIHDSLRDLGAEVLQETLERLAEGRLERRPQDDAAATYAPLLTRDIERVRWGRPAVEVHNLARGLNPWPGAYFIRDGRSVKLWRTRRTAQQAEAADGAVLALTEEGFTVAAGGRALEVLEVQPAGKRRMKACDYVCGYGLRPGDRLE